jgi:hypothetical protein
MKKVKRITHKNKEEVLKQAEEYENGFCMFVRAKGSEGKWFKEIIDSYNEKLLIYSMWDGT